MTSIRDENLSVEFETSLLDEQISSAPFADSQPEFEVSHSTNIIEKLVHLSRFGNLLTLVVGDNGSGKTRLLEKFLSTIDDNCQICHIKAQPLLSIDQLFQQVTESFAGDAVYTGIPLTANQYEEWAVQLASIPGNRLLIMDDAEVLSTSVLHELCQLSAMQQEKETPHLHLILFGNYDLNAILEQAALGILTEDGIYTIDIPSLSEDESRSWLEYILTKSGVDSFPEPDEMDDMLAEGQGNLASLAECAELFATISQEPHNFETTQETWKISVVGYWFGALTILILLVLGLFVFKDELADLSGLRTGNPLQEANSTQTVLDASKEMSDANPSINDEKTAADEVVTKITKPADSGLAGLDDRDSSLTEKRRPEDNARDIVIDKSEPDTKSLDIAKPIEAKPTEVMKAEVKSYSYSNDEKFLMSEPDTGFVVQLIGLSEDSAARAFIAKYNISTMRYYRSSLNSKPWYIIILGSYTSRDKAITARDKLPTDLVKYGPWIKQIKVIKKEISTARTLSRE